MKYDWCSSSDVCNFDYVQLHKSFSFTKKILLQLVFTDLNSRLKFPEFSSKRYDNDVLLTTSNFFLEGCQELWE